jgi:hypothetical protein
MSNEMQKAIDEVRAVEERASLGWWIDKIPGDEGFTKGGEAYHEAGLKLLALGMNSHEVVEFLSGLYWAAASEYGD